MNPRAKDILAGRLEILRNSLRARHEDVEDARRDFIRALDRRTETRRDIEALEQEIDGSLLDQAAS